MTDMGDFNRMVCKPCAARHRACIAELEAERNALRDQYESAVSVIKHFGEEGDEGDTLGNIVQRIIERGRKLQAIVDKLDKTEDGVPIILGMNCAVIDNDETDGLTVRDDVGVLAMTSEGPDELCRVTLRSGSGEEWTVSNEDLYSTREAAEAAKDDPS